MFSRLVELGGGSSLEKEPNMDLLNEAGATKVVERKQG
jgi:hypothetical protein